jgi:PiT family inorganic phosphate transporter
MTQKGLPLGVDPAPAVPRPSVKKTLDKDLKKLVRIEEATQQAGRRLTGLGIGVIFLALVWWFSALQTGAGIVGGYMALNIGANDVANNVGPAVGARALTMMGALVIAAVFEAMGAILAGGDVVATVSKGIIDPTRIESSEIFITAMLAALFAAALWVNLATYVSAPVSTTHAIVGGVMGAGIAAAGFGVVAWGTMAKIAASWVISPVLGGVIAALFLAFIKLAIVYQDDKIAAAKRWVPVLVALMAGVFSAYLVMKGLKRVWKPDLWLIAENRNKSVRSLFTIPLICSAALLSFAHGSNDVANAVGPLSAIVSVVGSGDISAKVEIPLWVMLIGAAGISLGLVLFGPKLVRRVGQEITKMNPMRAYCVALSAAITVILASALGLPVSSTHIAVGAVFGVGFFREYFTARRPRLRRYNTGKETTGKETRDDGSNNGETVRRRKLVRRSHLMTIVAAWVITVPATAVMAAGLFFAFSAL